MPAQRPTLHVVADRPAERRGAERFVANMPVRVAGRDGITQDLSISGLSFLCDRPYEPGSRVELVVEYLLDGHNYPLRCEAEVVRAEPAGSAYRIGARLAPDPTRRDTASANAVRRGGRLRSI